MHVPGLLENDRAVVLDGRMLRMPLKLRAESPKSGVGFAMVGQQTRLGERQVQFILGVRSAGIVIQQRQRLV